MNNLRIALMFAALIAAAYVAPAHADDVTLECVALASGGADHTRDISDYPMGGLITGEGGEGIAVVCRYVP